jgi:hypothetical protein
LARLRSRLERGAQDLAVLGLCRAPVLGPALEQVDEDLLDVANDQLGH